MTVEARRIGSPDSLTAAGIVTLVECGHNLDLLPPSATRLLQLAQNANAALPLIASVAKTDPGLAARVLAVANSATYAGRLSGRIVSIQKALSRVGLEVLKGIVIQRAMSAPVLRVPGVDHVIGEVTKHSVIVAVATRSLARALGLDGELGFTIGLLHDVGKIVGLQAYARSDERVKNSIVQDPRGLVPLLDATHEELGRHAAKGWCLPDLAVQSIGHHHTMGPRHFSLQFPLITRAADLIAHQLAADSHRDDPDVREIPEIAQIGLNAPILEQVIKSTPAEAAELQRAFR
jgi:putative nucleotidyltransferase with HDIG domain